MARRKDLYEVDGELVSEKTPPARGMPESRVLAVNPIERVECHGDPGRSPFLAKIPAPRHRVPSVPAFRKMRVAPGTRTFTDISRNSDSRRRDPRRKSGSHLTPCWREVDSNSRSRCLKRRLLHHRVELYVRRRRSLAAERGTARFGGGDGSEHLLWAAHQGRGQTMQYSFRHRDLLSCGKINTAIRARRGRSRTSCLILGSIRRMAAKHQLKSHTKLFAIIGGYRCSHSCRAWQPARLAIARRYAE